MNYKKCLKNLYSWDNSFKNDKIITLKQEVKKIKPSKTKNILQSNGVNITTNTYFNGI